MIQTNTLLSPKSNKNYEIAVQIYDESQSLLTPIKATTAQLNIMQKKVSHKIHPVYIRITSTL